ncbi:ribonuclease VapC [Betaproteobacteria bacterium]|nr:ribonuclease VapC [Betaproteobacteria bacterium]
MIIDTDVLIWYFRGNEKAKAAISKAVPFSVSTISVMELMQGARNKAEQKAMNRQLRAWGVNIIHIGEAISIRATQYISDFALGHSMTATDALIAGTVVESGDKLLTANTKHFECVPGMALQRFRP